jgi:predicted HTH domain antitoxin
VGVFAVTVIIYYRWKKVTLDEVVKIEHAALVQKTQELAREHKQLELERQNHDVDRYKKELEALQR